MEFQFTKAEEALVSKVREFIKKEATPELIKETHWLEGTYGGKEARKFFRRFATNGWLAPDWPKEYGGLASTHMVAYLIRDELSYAGLPGFFTGAHMAGPTIMRFGSEEIKNKYLLPIALGEIEFALGYTEPGAGSDLMALRMFAEDKGDHFIVNGQKLFNTACHVAEYHWLAVRTNLEAPKHKGISLLIVDLNSPGIIISPLMTMSGSRTNVVYYDNVSVPKANLVGDMNKGVQYIMTALDFERTFPFGVYRGLFDRLLDYSKQIVGGKAASENPILRQDLADLAIELEVAKLLYYQLPYMLDKGAVPSHQSSMEKLFVSEVSQRITCLGVKILGLHSQLKDNCKYAPLEGIVGMAYRQSLLQTIVAGTSEIQRSVIANRGLGLPRQ